MKKKITALLLCMALVLSLLPAGALAVGDAGTPTAPETTVAGEVSTQTDPNAITTSGTCGANINWEMTQNNPGSEAPTYTLTLTGTGAMADYETRGTPWYPKREAITQIILPEGLTSIGESAFLETKITEVTIPSTVTSIGTIAFWNCNTICTEIPAAVTEIGATAFYGTFNLTVNAANPTYIAENNVLYNKDKTKLVQVSQHVDNFTIPNTVTEICGFAMNGCKLLTGTLTIPDSVRTVGNGAFGGTKYTGIVLSKTMTKIGDAMFSGLPLSGELIIPDTITEIGANAFAKCTNLTEINIPEQVTSIGYAAFSFNTGVTKITVPLGNITYGKNAEGKSYIFSMCNTMKNKVAVSGNLKTVVIGSTPKDVNVYTLFSNSWKGLETLVLGSGVGELNVWNLSDSGNLSKVLYPSTLTLTRSNDRFTNVATKYTLATETSLPFGDTLPMLSFDKQAPTGITYTSSHPEIVSVDANGNMKALQLTNEPVTISASYEDCVFTKLTLTVLKDASSAAISGVNKAYPYTGEEVKPVPTVKLGDTVLKSGTDYDVTYEANINAGQAAKVIVTFKGNYKGSKIATFEISAAALAVTAADYNGVYDGQEHKITVTAPEGATISYCTTVGGTYGEHPVLKNADTTTVYFQVTKDNHTTVTGSQIVTITPAPLTITAKSYYIYVGGTAPTTYEYTVTGLVSGEKLSTNPTVACPTADVSKVGTYPITITGATATNNYALSSVNGSLNVVNYADEPQSDFSSGSEINSSDLQWLAAQNKALTVTDNGGAKLKFSPEALKELAKGGNKITITISDAGDKLNEEQKKIVGDRPVFDLTVMSGKTIITDFGGGTVEVTLPYVLKENENPDLICVWLLGEDGSLTPVFGSYDPVSKTLRFTTKHFSRYVVGEWINCFTDVAKGAWYYESVAKTNMGGLMSGVSKHSFAPNANATRAMQVSMLYRMAGSPAVGSEGSKWYDNARTWAMAQGVSDGCNMEENITREQLVTMLYRYAKGEKIQGDLSGFADADAISDFARESMNWAVAKGIIHGDAGRLKPQGNATRAEIATVFKYFMGMNK